MTIQRLPDAAPTVEDIRTWPATVDVRTACTVYGISGSHGYELIKRGEFPARVIHLGSRRARVITASILATLGEETPA